MGKYCAFCCYFGNWPSHFQFWLNSCGYNRNIAFFLVSDIDLSMYEVPQNVVLIRLSFSDLVQLIQQKFSEVKVSIERPYKLCDFKTAYGYIFEDYCKGYDYWGYYDIDTIWGQIEKFIPANDDNHLVKIFPCGHLSFIRNIAPWNKVYELVNQVAGTPCRNNMEGKKVVTWQECFSSPNSYYYDEEGGLEPLFASLKEPVYTEVDFDNILPPWRFDHFFSINFPEKSHFLVFAFNDGLLKRYYLKHWGVCAEEISYVHLSKRSLKIKVSVGSEFSIVPNAVIGGQVWNLLKLLYYGRPQRLKNFIQRIKARLSRLLNLKKV